MMGWELLGDVRLFLHAVGWALAMSFVVGCGVGAVLWALLRLTSRRSAWSRYALACGSLVLMLGTLAQSWSAISSSYDGHGHSVEMYALQLMGEGAPDPTGPLPGGWHAADLSVAVEALHDHEMTPWLSGRTALVLGSVLAVLAVAWFVGVGIRLGALSHALLRVRGLRRRATPRVDRRWTDALERLRRRMGVRIAPTLAISDEIDGPVLVGWLHPMILLPPGPHARLSDAEVEAVLAHELAHVRRGDYVVNVIQMLVEAILLHHPVVYWIGERIRDEREYCSDDVARRATRGSLSTYLRALATLEALRMDPVPEPAVGVGGRSLLGRIRRLMAVEGRPRPRPAHDIAFVIIGLLLVWAPTVATAKLAPDAAYAVMKHDLALPTDFEAIRQGAHDSHGMKGDRR